MSNEKPVELTEAERNALDVAGMFPTQFGWEHPEKWEKSTVRSIGAKVGRIVASRVARIVAQGYVPVTEVAAREAAARREALLEAKTLAAGRYGAWLPSPGLSSDWVAGWHAANNDITTTLQVAIERDEEGR